MPRSTDGLDDKCDMRQIKSICRRNVSYICKKKPLEVEATGDEGRIEERVFSEERDQLHAIGSPCSRANISSFEKKSSIFIAKVTQRCFFSSKSRDRVIKTTQHFICMKN